MGSAVSRCCGQDGPSEGSSRSRDTDRTEHFIKEAASASTQASASFTLAANREVDHERKVAHQEVLQSEGLMGQQTAQSQDINKLELLPTEQKDTIALQLKSQLQQEQFPAERLPAQKIGSILENLQQQQQQQTAGVAALGVAQPGCPYYPQESGPPLPGCEPQRLAAAAGFYSLDSRPPSSPQLSNMLQLVCKIFNTSNALIALLQDKRVYTVDGTGVFHAGDFPWRQSMCAWTMAAEQAQVLLVNDTTKDARFKNNPAVWDYGVRFYCGAPLMTDTGHRLGTLSFADSKPHYHLGPYDCQILVNFAQLVSRELQRDMALRATEAVQPAVHGEEVQQYKALKYHLELADGPTLLVDTSQPGFTVVYANSSWADVTGVTNTSQVLGTSLWELFADAAGRPLQQQHLKASCAGGGTCLLPRVTTTTHITSGRQACDLRFSPASTFASVQLAATRAAPPAAACVALPPNLDYGAPPSPAAKAYYIVSVELQHDPGRSNGTSSTIGLQLSGTSGTIGPSSTTSTFGSSGDRFAAPTTLEGLELGPAIAAGSYGRVFRGKYRGQVVAVKVLDSDAVLKRDVDSGGSLEALLSSELQHPNIVATLTWAEVHGKAQLPQREVRVGDTWTTMANTQSDVKSDAVATVVAKSSGGQQQQQQDDKACTDHAWSSSGGGFDSSSSVVSSSRDGGGQTWLVMEYCNKGCLQDALDKGWLREGVDGPPNLCAVFASAHDIASGLQHLHSKGIVHGDLSAFNIMLTSTQPGAGGPDAAAAAAAAAGVGGQGFVAKVADFGLAQRLGFHSNILTRTYGTVTHMSPELLLEGRLSKAADVYSFGVLLWQMYCSSRAWAGMSHAAVIHAVCHQGVQLQFPPGALDGYVALAVACMAAQPEQRPTMEDVVEVLGPVAQLAAEAAITASGHSSASDFED